MIIASVSNFLLEARAIAASHGSSLAVATLLSWLLTEGLGAYMLSRLLTGRTGRRRPYGVSPLVMFGHAGLAFAGFVCWVSFLVTSSEALAWLAVGLLAPAIGLGISAVTVWTPYPRAVPETPTTARLPTGDTEKLADALRDDAATSKLIDDMLASLLTAPSPRRNAWRLSPLIPAAHGLLAVVTFLLATLAAVTYQVLRASAE